MGFGFREVDGRCEGAVRTLGFVILNINIIIAVIIMIIVVVFLVIISVAIIVIIIIIQLSFTIFFIKSASAF